MGWQEDVGQWIESSVIHLRMTEHDGLPKTILEALAYGRQVISTQKFPHCYVAANYEKLKVHFDHIITAPKLNVAGAEYIKKHFHPKIVKEQLADLYNSL